MEAYPTTLLTIFLAYLYQLMRELPLKSYRALGVCVSRRAWEKSRLAPTWLLGIDDSVSLQSFIADNSAVSRSKTE
jgi:hypothetical protein